MGRRAALILGAVVIVGWISCRQAAPQPVPFPHKSHVDLRMECAACHTGAEQGTHAGIPGVDACAVCHVPGRDFPPTPASLKPYVEEKKEIPWRQVHRTPRHVYFSHRRHTALAGLDCGDCHGDVKTMTEPFTEPAFAAGLPGMDRCVECHRKEGVTTDCMACHR